MFHYYIYYRVNSEHVLQADSAVKQIQDEIEAQFSVVGRLLKKRDEPLLWMEIYENVAASAAFEATLKAAENKAGVARYLDDGQRHLECFVA